MNKFFKKLKDNKQFNLIQKTMGFNNTVSCIWNISTRSCGIKSPPNEVTYEDKRNSSY